MTVIDFLENYPELRIQLMEYAPELQDVQGTDLFNTIASAVTLQQLADNLEQPVLKIVSELRSRAGAVTGVAFDSDATAPVWFQSKLVRTTLDARELLANGGHPLMAVFEGMTKLSGGEIFELITPFLPEPLIERLRQEDYPGWSSCDEEGLFHNYFLKAGE